MMSPQNTEAVPGEGPIYSTRADANGHGDIRQHLRTELARFKDLMGHGPRMIVVFDADTTILHCNEGYARLFGMAPQDLRGEKWITFIPDEERAQVKQHLATFRPEDPFGRHTNGTIDGNGDPRHTEWLNHRGLKETAKAPPWKGPKGLRQNRSQGCIRD